MTLSAPITAFNPLLTTQVPCKQDAQAPRKAASRPQLQVRLAQSEQDVQQAFALRAQTFGKEFGLEFEQGLDQDRFDPACQHVLVFSEDEKQLVATTRLMTRKAAALTGQFYTQNEFDLTQLLADFSGEILEVGRSCVHPDYRSMSAINALWQGIGDVAANCNAKALLGCASLPIDNGDIQGWLNSLDDAIKITAYPKTSLPSSANTGAPTLPPLLKAYLRMGSLVGDTACFDPEFNCADVLIWFPFTRMDKRYLSRFGKNIEVG